MCSKAHCHVPKVVKKIYANKHSTQAKCIFSFWNAENRTISQQTISFVACATLARAFSGRIMAIPLWFIRCGQKWFVLKRCTKCKYTPTIMYEIVIVHKIKSLGFGFCKLHYMRAACVGWHSVWNLNMNLLKIRGTSH